MIIIRKNETLILGSGQKPVENKIAWSYCGVEKRIIAIGGPSNWGSAESLPSGATLEDLVQLSFDDPEFASALWNRFLLYIDTLVNPGILASLRGAFCGIRVKLEISDLQTKQAVANVLRKSKPFKIKVIKG